MSRLSVFWPDETNTVEAISAALCLAEPDEPAILPFRSHRPGANPVPQSMDVITRARVLFNNRKCHDCGYPVVEPIEHPDALRNRAGLSIPGTATLIGFHCCGCQNEWSV